MPCPHGIGDCSSICHLRTISPFRQRSDKTFIVGGLDSGRPPYPDRCSSRHWHVFRVLSLSLLRSPWHLGGLGVSDSAPSAARKLLQIIPVRNRSRKRYQQGRCVAISGPLSSPIPLTLYCICKSVIGTFAHLPRIV
jgi:hypothetical protein